MITSVGRIQCVDKAKMYIAGQFISEDRAVSDNAALFTATFPPYLQNTLKPCERRNHQIPGGELKWS